MSGKKGFTLVELLVVIAIIMILASIVAPRVTSWISRAQMAKAVSEIRNADLALTKMLMDASVTDFSHFFPPGLMARCAANYPAIEATGTVYKAYDIVFYELLRQGKNANFFPFNDGFNSLVLKDDVRRKLATSYMDLAGDPFTGANYQFYAGPLNSSDGMYARFRSHRGAGYLYNMDKMVEENVKRRGNPYPAPFVHGWPYFLRGYPAPYDLPVYIYSYGNDNVPNDGEVSLDQNGEDLYGIGVLGDGGDDVNNWDSEQGWSEFY